MVCRRPLNLLARLLGRSKTFGPECGAGSIKVLACNQLFSETVASIAQMSSFAPSSIRRAASPRWQKGLIGFARQCYAGGEAIAVPRADNKAKEGDKR